MYADMRSFGLLFYPQTSLDIIVYLWQNITKKRLLAVVIATNWSKVLFVLVKRKNGNQKFLAIFYIFFNLYEKTVIIWRDAGETV